MTATKANQRKVLVCDPTAEEVVIRHELASRLKSLEGRTVGLLDNSKDLVDTLLDEIKILLVKDFPDVKFRYFRKDSASSGVSAQIYSELTKCDAVITGIGD